MTGANIQRRTARGCEEKTKRFGVEAIHEWVGKQCTDRRADRRSEGRHGTAYSPALRLSSAFVTETIRTELEREAEKLATRHQSVQSVHRLLQRL